MSDPAQSAAAAPPPEPPRRSRFKQWEQRFLEALRIKGSAQAAALVAGVSRRTIYKQRKRSPSFAARWDEIVNANNEMLEGAAFERAVHGVVKTRFYKDVPIATEREYSDGLTQFLLEKRMPEKYGRNATQGDDEAEAAAKIVAAVAAMRGTVAPPPEVAHLSAQLAALQAEIERLRALVPAAKPRRKRKRRKAAKKP